MYPSKQDVENYKTSRWMKYLFAGALGFLVALGADLAFGAEKCPQGQSSLEEVAQKGAGFVASGNFGEGITLRGESLALYIAALNARGVAAPKALTEAFVAVRKDGSAAFFGFKNECLDGTAILMPGTHQIAIGTEG